MALGPVVKSVLKSGIKDLPEDFAVKAESVPNVLKKLGAKEEELKFADLQLPAEGKVTKSQLVEAEAGRADVFTEAVQKDSQFNWVSLPKGRDNPTYKETVYKFTDKNKAGSLTDFSKMATELKALRTPEEVEAFKARYRDAVPAIDEFRLESWLERPVQHIEQELSDLALDSSRYVSEHFPAEADYLMHTRTYDDVIDGRKTRVLQEVQSDLHQQGRQQGYGEARQLGAADKEEVSKLLAEGRKLYDDMYEGAVDRDSAFARVEEIEVALRQHFPHMPADFQWADDAVTVDTLSNNIPKSPYEKTWLRKGIEREVAKAFDEGREQLAIPIKGSDIEALHRAGGVQQWYETQVVNTAKKLAKQHNMDFELVTTGGKVPANEVDALRNAFAELGDAKSALERARDIEALQVKHHGPNVEDWIIPANEQVLSAGYKLDSIALKVDDLLKTKYAKYDLGLSSESTLKELENATSGMQYAVLKPKGLQDSVKPPTKAELISRLKELRAKAVEAEDTAHKKLMADDIEGFHKAKEEYDEVRAMYTKEFPAYVNDNIMSMSDNALDTVASMRELDYIEDAPKLNTLAGAQPVKDFSLYASPAAAGFATYLALQQGMTEEQAVAGLQAQGYDEEDVAQVLADVEQINKAKAAGATDAQIKRHMQGLEQVQTGEDDATPEVVIDPEVMTKSDAKKQLLKGEQLAAQDLVAKLQVIQPNMASVTRRIRAFGGHNESVKIADQMERNSVQNIVNLAKDRGIDLVWQNGEFFAQTEQGTVKVTPTIWQDLWSEKGEIAGAIAGGIQGARMGAAAIPAVKHPLARAGMIAGTSIAGAVVGSVLGTEGDYIYNAIELQEDISAETAAHKALTAAEASVIGDVVGLGVIGSFKGGWRAIKRAKDLVVDGNNTGAFQALKETLFITDEQADEIIRKLGTKTEVAGRSPEERAIAATILTEPGGESIVKAAGAVDPQAGATIVKSVDQRAKDLLATTADISDENVGKLIKGELEGYTSAVKDFYANVKDQAINSPRANAFEFDYQKLALDPVLETLHKNITDPVLRQKFLYQMENIKSMSDSRTFSDLLELRQLVNEFKYNKRITKQADWKAVNSVLTEIDGAIREGSDIVMENPSKWRADYATARKQYGDMKALEKNVLARLLNRKGVDEKTITRGLTKYIGALDDTFHEVMIKLPKATRAKTEGAVVDVLANKYTAGLEGGLRATNFPMLAKDLEVITFTTPEARRAKKAVMELAEVFKNDVPLSQATGNIQIPKFQSYLTTDPVVRAKFELASGVFNYVKTLAPGQQQRNLALVRKAAKVLEQPMNSKLMRELMEEAGDSVDIQPMLLKLAEEAAKRNAAEGDKTLPRIKLFGNKSVLSTKGSGTEYSIPTHRIATIEQAKTAAEAYGVNPQNKKLLDETLKNQGFKAVQIGSDKVRRID